MPHHSVSRRIEEPRRFPGGGTLHAGNGNELGNIVRCRIVASQRRSHDQLVIERAETDMRLRALGHGAGESLLA
jgi:hypothetical protein